MKINRFYTEVLGAYLRNPRWAWGAKDSLTNRIYLRVWDDQIEEVNGHKRVELIRDMPRTKSPGYRQREGHLQEIKDGVEGYGVICTAVDPNPTGAREIKSFDETTLLRFGTLENDKGFTFARIEEQVPVIDVARKQTAQSTLAEELKPLLKIPERTTRETMVDARMGQGKFRAQVMQLWSACCCVTGAVTEDAIRASHIKPWSKSTDEERLDPYNGLLLTANLDALFDAGLISFDNSGQLLISSKLSDSERELFCLTNRSLEKPPSPKTIEYLEYHRGTEFQR